MEEPYDPYNPDDPYDPGYVDPNPGNEQPSPNNPTEPSHNNIIDSLQGYPCAQVLLGQLPNLKNNIANLIKNTFLSTEINNITFKAADLTALGASGVENGQLQNGGYNSIVRLDQNVLSQATQEYILVTMYHESIHSYIRAEHVRLEAEEFAIKFPHVEEYELQYGNGSKVKKYRLDSNHPQFGPFVEDMAQAIRSFNGDFPLDRARALAKMGVVDATNLTNQEKLFNDYERRDPNHLNYEQIKNLFKGYDCND